ncbi:MAG: hypothetical protein A3A97_03830 [Candidatus Terrybacteria bacterium RIFCSPLOWO2_01_FULL_40_23]|uniref:Cell division protein FtsL n=1 Tax=Candidatus Terrybacteria bacterium RIFCSPLOWO2_01_FULL_40_23 TaxID=1802366 RepID=A0A1G2PSM1_9BACT|nr:MAG: hypothetical protein A3A97_03830 [Candidatus Terrybacteria bacterium RIFCSPLOWO2_01_FULL_40_23]
MRRKLVNNRIKFVFIPVVIIIAGILFNAARVQYEVWKTQEYIKKLEQKTSKLEQENASVLSLIESALNDPVKIEREARARLNLKKPDEEVVILIPQKDGQTEQIKEKDGLKEDSGESFLVQLWNKIFGKENKE